MFRYREEGEKESCGIEITWNREEMSTENQNGSAGTQSNGIKTTIGWSSTTRTVSNNSSFLHTSNSMLNRDKPRQVPPPTLPKYTSSFNAGWNGSGTTERLSRDREVGGSYRLASLDRLALRQRILDGEKSNGDTTSVSLNIRYGEISITYRLLSVSLSLKMSFSVTLDSFDIFVLWSRLYMVFILHYHRTLVYLYKIFWSLKFGKIWNEFEKVYTGSEIFTAEIHLVKN